LKLSLDAFLSDVEKRLADATDGPWEYGVDDECGAVVWNTVDGERDTHVAYIGTDLDPGNGEFISHAPQDVAGLVAVVSAVMAIPYCQRDPETVDENHEYQRGYDQALDDIAAAMESAVPDV
jgi:hypothetical protein